MNSYTLHQFLHLARRHLLHFDTVKIREPITVAARSEAWVCSRSLAGIVGSNPSGACVYFVLSGRGLFVGLITRPEVSYRVWCVWVCSWILANEDALAHEGYCAMVKIKKIKITIICKSLKRLYQPKILHGVKNPKDCHLFSYCRWKCFIFATFLTLWRRNFLLNFSTLCI